MSELPVNNLLSVSQAIAILDSAPVRSRVVRFPLLEATGLRLAEAITADRDYPPFNKAVMDGFAVRAADVQSPGVELQVIETIAAGATGSAVGPGQTAAIMTGAPLPDGCDTVVPVEHTSRLPGRVCINTPPKLGNAVAPRGSDTLAAQVLLEPGVRLGAAQIAVAASVGAATVSVFARPVVAVLSTGDELIDIDQIPTGSQIRNSNSLMLVALLRQLGCDVRHVEHVRDTMENVLAAIRSNLQHDALFITGGMSMGEFDFVPKALLELGPPFQISKLRIKPGKPFVYTRLNDDRCHVFGLPGNPVSAYVCTLRLASRVLAKFTGGSPDERVGTAQLATAVPANGPRELYLPAMLTGTIVTPFTPNGSADVFTLARANALLIRSESCDASAAGSSARVLTLD